MAGTIDRCGCCRRRRAFSVCAQCGMMLCFRCSSWRNDDKERVLTPCKHCRRRWDEARKPCAR